MATWDGWREGGKGGKASGATGMAAGSIPVTWPRDCIMPAGRPPRRSTDDGGGARAGGGRARRCCSGCTWRRHDRKTERQKSEERERQRVYYALNISATRIRCVLSPFCRRRRAALCTVGGHRRPAACLSLSLSPSLKWIHHTGHLKNDQADHAAAAAAAAARKSTEVGRSLGRSVG